MNIILEQYANFLEEDKHLAINTLQSYKRDLKQYIHYLNEIGIVNFVNTNKTNIVSFLSYLQKKVVLHQLFLET